jgi:hypothetical protein
MWQNKMAGSNVPPCWFLSCHGPPPPGVSLTRPVAVTCAVLTIVGCLLIRDQYTGALSCAWQQPLSSNLHKSNLPSTITNLTCFQISSAFTIRFINTLIYIQYSPLLKLGEGSLGFWNYVTCNACDVVWVTILSSYSYNFMENIIYCFLTTRTSDYGPLFSF